MMMMPKTVIYLSGHCLLLKDHFDLNWIMWRFTFVILDIFLIAFILMDCSLVYYKINIKYYKLFVAHWMMYRS
jgi:hypothetical protein